MVENNQFYANQQDGVRLVSESTNNDVRNNVIGDNGRYGVYVDTEGPYTLAANTIFGSRVGLLIKGAAQEPDDDNDLYGNREADVKNR